MAVVERVLGRDTNLFNATHTSTRSHCCLFGRVIIICLPRHNSLRLLSATTFPIISASDEVSPSTAIIGNGTLNCYSCCCFWLGFGTGSCVPCHIAVCNFPRRHLLLMYFVFWLSEDSDVTTIERRRRWIAAKHFYWFLTEFYILKTSTIITQCVTCVLSISSVSFSYLCLPGEFSLYGSGI